MKRFKDKETMLKIKQVLKHLADDIRVAKSKRSPKNRTKKDEDVDWNYKVWQLRWEFRHTHIPYCLMRGAPMNKIENPREDNLPNMSKIQDFIDEYGE